MNAMEPAIAILGIGTAVPPYQLEQTDASQRLADALADNPEAARWAKRIFKQSAVETRYTCEPNLLEPAAACRYVPSKSLHDTPTTAERMDMYKVESVPLSLQAAAGALLDSRMKASEITHLITVSCTGLFLPGIDIALIDQLGLEHDVKRIPLTFLGCAAGLTAVRLARELVEGNPSARVLLVCMELCTLHIQPSSEREDLFATAFFGDGAAACVIGRSGLNQRGIFALEANHSAIVPGSKEDMGWKVGNYGFNLYLSPRIPELIGKYVPAEIERLFAGSPMPELWAIHPGGRGIIDKLQALYELTDEQTHASRSVLRDYGNMSSATILFVLQEMRAGLRSQLRVLSGQDPKRGIALAFGPGLSMELQRIRFIEPSFYLGEACD